jgi:hypothetical protein
MKKEITFEDWKKELEKCLLERYCLPITEIDEDSLSTAYEEGETPQEFVEWYGNKYDLLEF